MDLSRARNFLLTRESEFRVRVSETDEKMIDKITSGRSFMVAAIAILEPAILAIQPPFFFICSWLSVTAYKLQDWFDRERTEKRWGLGKDEDRRERKRERAHGGKYCSIVIVVVVFFFILGMDESVGPRREISDMRANQMERGIFKKQIIKMTL